jgi:hypothetical protein
MLRFLLYAVPLVVTLYAFIDAVQTPGQATRSLPKWVWLLVIVVVPFLGAVAWLLAGRPARETYVAEQIAAAGEVPRPTGFAGRRRAPTAPDDDPSFLRKLDDDAWSRRMRAKRAGDTGGDAGSGLDHPDDTPDTATH